MPDKKNHVTITITKLLGIIALASGLFLFQHVHLQKTVGTTQFHGTLLDNPREVNAFSLTGTDGKPFNNASLKGQWTMIFFGFTNCGYLCPTTMAELGKMYRLLEEKGVRNLPRVVMISIDPERDNLEKLNHYVNAFNSHFYGARGDDSAISAMTREMGIAYEKVINKEAINHENKEPHYEMDHTGTIMLFNPQGQLSAFFTTPHQAELLAKDYLMLVS